MKRILIVALIIVWLISACSFLGFPSTQTTNEPVSSVETQDGNDFPPPIETISPTIIPSSHLSRGETALLTGDFENALQEFQIAFDQSSDPELKARALLGIGRTYYADHDYPLAIDAFNRLLGQYPASNSIAHAYFYLGKSYTNLKEYTHAVEAYSHYLQLKPGILDAYVYELLGDAAFAGSDFNIAINAYQATLQANPSGDANNLNLKIGQAYAGKQDYATAIQILQAVYDNTTDDYVKASADLLMGQAYLSLDLNNEGYTKLMDTVIQFPRARDSFTALTILTDKSVPVDDLLRGIVEYYSGEYTDAIQSFDRAIAGNSLGDGTIFYYKGLSHYFANQPGYAIQAYDQLIQNYPDNRFWTSAWDEKAYVQWYLKEEYTNAANTLFAFVNQAPKAAEAPGFLYEAGRILERKDDLEGAAQTWRRLMDEYPAYERSYRALFLAGITYYRMGKFEDALSIFQRCAVLASNNDDKAAAYFWIGKTHQARSEPDQARTFWQQVERTDPTDYYGIRAGELQNGFPPLQISALYDFGYDLDFERSEAESWLRSTFKLTAGMDLNNLSQLFNDPRIQRGQEMWQLGLFEQASSEFETVRTESATDPAKTYQLMNYLYSLGLYRPAILACRNLLDLAGMDDLTSLTAPIYFTHIRFGAYFRPQVVKAALEENIHPLVLYALLRQESLFESFITSSAGARGLAQIMPATGKETYDRIGWPSNYTADDLYRANVSILYSVDYLARMQHYLNGDLFAALAAYNGGPGNAEIWKYLSKNDPDLFLEVIRAEETQTYLKQIIEFVNIYKLIYTHPE